MTDLQGPSNPLTQTTQEKLDNAISSTPPPTQDTPKAEQPQKKRRAICSRCHRPTPKACICEGLPPSPIVLKKCHILVLQHPHETRRKNCSLPLLQLCLDPTSITVVVSRRFGDQMDPSAMALLQSNNHRVLLIFPAQPEEKEYLADQEDDDSATKEKNNNHKTLSLSEAKEYCTSNNNSSDHDDRTNTVIIILDATWKYAKEMDKANVATGQYPTHMRRVALSWEDPLRPVEAMVPRRFDIRTPPSQVHLSTAECIAWVLSALEGDSIDYANDETANTTILYSTLMKPLDCMVAKWHECRRSATDNHAHYHQGRRKKKGKQSGDREQEEHQSTTASSRDYDYYANPDHAKIQEVEEDKEEKRPLSRASFFTMGDSDNQTRGKQKQNSKKRRHKN